MLKALVSIIVFQTAWAACAYGAVNGVPEIGVMACLASLFLGVLLTRRRLGLLGLAVALGLYGATTETIILSLNLSMYSAAGPYSHLAPIWIVTLWMAFATLIKPALGWLDGRPFLATLLGAAMGPVAYYAAMRLGALRFAEPEWMGLIAIAVMWAIAMPLALAMSRKLQGSG